MNVTLYNKEDFVYMMTLKILRCVDYPGLSVQFSSFQSLSHVRLFVTPWTVTRQACLSFTISQSLLKLMSIESIYKNEKKPSSGLYQDFCEPLFSFSSVHFSHSVMSDSLRPHESQHARPPCPSPTPRVHSDSRPSSQ